jgi:hypothetical protein
MIQKDARKAVEETMRRLIRIAVRCLAVVVVPVVIAAVFSAGTPKAGPYLSALATLSAREALASQTCTNRGCATFGVGCVHKKGVNCRRIDICSETSC